MNAEESTISSSWNVNRVRSDLLNGPPSGQDARPLLQAFQKIKSHILVIRQLAAGKQAKLLEIINQLKTLTLIAPHSIVCDGGQGVYGTA